MSDRTSPPRILVVDDEPDIRGLIQDILEDEGYRVEVASSAAEARELKRRDRPDLVLLDIWMPEVDGVTLLKQWAEAGELDAPVVMMSGHGTVETAVEATRHGARDFVEKPLSTAKLLRTVLSALAEAAPAEAETPRVEEVPVGNSRQMRDLRERISNQARMRRPLLLVSEPGPEARIWAGYYLSHWPETIDHPLRQDLASADAHSPLFIAEVGDLSMEQQWRLLERLRQAEGGSGPPLILASRHAQSELRQKSELLPDLAEVFRHVLVLPTLQQRSEDIPELLEYYATFFSEHENLPYRHFSVAAQNRLRNRPWPGGLEQLKAEVRRILSRSDAATVELAELEAPAPETPPTGGDDRRLKLEIDLDWDLRQAREHFEREYLRRQLELCRNNVSELARKVGQERTNLYRKLKALGLQTRK